MAKKVPVKRAPLTHIPPVVYESTPITVRITSTTDTSIMERVDKPDSLRQYGKDVDYFRYTYSCLPEMIGKEIPMSHEQIRQLISYKLIKITFHGNNTIPGTATLF